METKIVRNIMGQDITIELTAEEIERIQSEARSEYVKTVLCDEITANDMKVNEQLLNHDIDQLVSQLDVITFKGEKQFADSVVNKYSIPKKTYTVQGMVLKSIFVHADIEVNACSEQEATALALEGMNKGEFDTNFAFGEQDWDMPVEFEAYSVLGVSCDE